MNLRLHHCTFLAVLTLVPGGCKTRNNNGASVKSTSEDSRCGFGGEWTKRAHQSASALVDFIDIASRRPQCKALLEAKPDLQNLRDSTAGTADTQYRFGRLTSLPSEIADLVAFIKTSGWLTGEARELTVAKSLEQLGARTDLVAEDSAATSTEISGNGDVSIGRPMKHLVERAKAAGVLGVSGLDRWLTALESNPQCLSAIGGSVGQILQSGTELIGAMATADIATSARLGGVMQKYLKFVQTSEVSSLLRSRQRIQMRETLSCLLKTVTGSYCAARDARAFLGLGYDPSRQPGESSVDSPVRGYELMFQHVPVLTGWLNQLTMPQAFRLRAVSDQYRELIQIPVDLEAYRRLVLRRVEANLYTMAGLSDEISRKGAMAGTIRAIAFDFENATFPARAVSRGSSEETSNGQSFPNFFNMKNQGYKIPFLLAGIPENEIPPVCIPGSPELAGAEPKDFRWYIEVYGYPQSFSSFELFRSSLLREINVWFDLGMQAGMEYFWKTVPVDFTAVAARAGAGFRITPISSMQAIRAYLLHYIVLIRKHNPPGMKSWLPVAMDQVRRLDVVLEAMRGVQSQNDLASAKEAIQVVYREFEMSLNRENLLPRRLQGMIESHITAVMLGHLPGREVLESQSMMIAERGAVIDLFERSGLAYSGAQKLSAEISAAQALSLQTIESIDSVWGEWFADDVRMLRQRAQGQWDAAAVREDSYRRSLRESRRTVIGRYKDVNDRFTRTFVDWMLLAKPLAVLNRSMHPDLFPMPPDGGFLGFVDDDAKSFATMWSYLCMQTLSLPGRERYRQSCSGATHGIPDSDLVPSGMRGKLLLNYDLWWMGRANFKPLSDGWTGSDPICTMYDYERRWRVYHGAAERYFNWDQQ